MRLYYTDSYLRRFAGCVIESLESAGHPAAVLDQSAFYPTSGGQPHDTGRLGPARVLDVVVRESDNAVVHLLDTALAAGPVEGAIDWERRFDHMQQHTGQHILSQAFTQVARAETIGFHLGVDAVSIDLAVPALTDAQVAGAEALANRIVTGNLEVRAWFPEEAELGALPLRKRPDVAGPVRIVAIGDFDHSACGGTHVARTGEVGLIAVLRVERLKRGTRVEFRCGHRARADYAAKHAIVRELSTLLTCAPAELPASITRLRDGLQEARRELALVREKELDTEAAILLEATPPERGRRIVRAAWPSRPVEEVRGLALRLTASPGVIALLGIAGERSQILFARGEDPGVDLVPVFRAALDALGGGKGGGARLLQGTAGPADPTRLGQVLAEAAGRIPGAG